MSGNPSYRAISLASVGEPKFPYENSTWTAFQSNGIMNEYKTYYIDPGHPSNAKTYEYHQGNAYAELSAKYPEYKLVYSPTRCSARRKDVNTKRLPLKQK